MSLSVLIFLAMMNFKKKGWTNPLLGHTRPAPKALRMQACRRVRFKVMR